MPNTATDTVQQLLDVLRLELCPFQDLLRGHRTDQLDQARWKQRQNANPTLRCTHASVHVSVAVSRNEPHAVLGLMDEAQ